LKNWQAENWHYREELTPRGSPGRPETKGWEVVSFNFSDESQGSILR
jgi:hypothetical protein